MKFGEVKDTSEFKRILALPRRVLNEKDTDLAEQMTRIFRLQLSTKPPKDKDPRNQIPEALLPIQAWGLHDIALMKGAFCPIRVGGGKTLFSLLAGFAAGAQRILILVPGGLLRKTRAAMNRYAAWWRIPVERIRIESYQALGRVQASKLLEAYDPDCIVCDEGHKLKNPDAAVTKRVVRHCAAKAAAGQKVTFVTMSGTFSNRSIRDYHHLAGIALPNSLFLPCTWYEADMWGKLIDERKGDVLRPEPGAFTQLVEDCDLLEPDGTKREVDTTVYRRAYRRRMTQTPGVIATAEGFEGPSLTVRTFKLPEDEAVHAAFLRLRTFFEAPDGFPLTEGMEGAQANMLAQALGNGFYYLPQPRPPAPWLAARKAWGQFVRSAMKDAHGKLDSEKMVAQACVNGKLDREIYDAWKAVRDTFVVNNVPQFLSHRPATFAAKWLLERGKGAIAWCSHLAVGEMIAHLAQVPFFSAKGRCERTKQYIEEYEGPCVASISSCGVGMNLQAYSQNLVMNPPPNGMQLEQLMGRTHRMHQAADEVVFDFAFTCAEDEANFYQSIADASCIEAKMGQAQKILYADQTTANFGLYNPVSPVWEKIDFSAAYEPHDITEEKAS